MSKRKASPIVEADFAELELRVFCLHPEASRVDGQYDGSVLPRYPLHHGSAQVAECSDCGSWHMPVHAPDRWFPGPYARDYQHQIEVGDDN